MNKVVIYTRVSGKHQIEGTSLQSQDDSCKALVAQNDWELTKVCSDPGVSGAYFEMRPGLQEVLRMLRLGEANILVCYSIDRLSRDTEIYARIKKEVVKAGGRIVYCDINFDDTDEGELMDGISSQFKQYERRVIRTRTMKGRRQKAEAGLQPCRTLNPFGWHIVNTTDITEGRNTREDAGKYVLVPEEAKRIRDGAVRLEARTTSLPKLAAEWESLGIPTRMGGKWRASTLHKIFTSRRLIGEATFSHWVYVKDESRVGQLDKFGRTITSPVCYLDRSKPENANKIAKLERPEVLISIPPIIEEDLFNRLQKALAGNRANQGGNPRQVKMLSSLVFCPECGARMQQITVGGKDKRRRSFQCSKRIFAKADRIEMPHGPGCYESHRVEEAVVTALLDVSQRPEVLEEALAAYKARTSVRTAGDNSRKELAAVDKALEALADQERRTAQAQIEALKVGGNVQVYLDLIADLAIRRKDLENRRGQLSAAIRPEPSQSPETPVDIAQVTYEEIEKALTSDFVTEAEKRALLGRIVERVIPSRKGAIIIFVPGALVTATFHRYKSPYKTTFSAAFSPEKKEGGRPGYYLCIDADGELLVGAGVHEPLPPQLLKVRQGIAKDGKKLDAILADSKFRKAFGHLQGERLKNVPRDFGPDHPYAEYLKHKSFTVGCTEAATKISDDAFAGHIFDLFATAYPLVKFLREISG